MALNKRLAVLICLSIGITSCAKPIKPKQTLNLVNAYEVETNGELEPSGLTLWDGVFYTVSDKDNFIYKLTFKDKTIALQPVIEVRNDKGAKLDFEGITHDQEFFYLISEKHFQLLKISKDGKHQSWLPSDNRLKLAGERVGLFETPNANFEGICLLNNGNFLLAAERQPRGFIEVDFNQNTINAYQQNQAVYQYKNNRSPDFTGLSCDNDIYVLDRNAEKVAKLIKVNGQYIETVGYSYQHIINQKQHQYQDMKYGQAEGLVVKGDKVYIILDNNRSYHSQNAENNNSLFLELHK